MVDCFIVIVHNAAVSSLSFKPVFRCGMVVSRQVCQSVGVAGRQDVDWKGKAEVV